MTETQAPYCAQFQEYLKPDAYLTEDGKKQPPPCLVCADACSRRRRAKSMRAMADGYDASADLMIMKGHP